MSLYIKLTSQKCRNVKRNSAFSVLIVLSLLHILPSAAQCPPQVTGYFPDASDCTAFYHCINGNIQEQSTCPQNLYWKVSFYGGGDCVQPSQTNCESGVPGGGSPGQISTYFMCPSQIRPGRLSLNGFYGEPFRCDAGYYLCVDMIATRMSCPNGMLWSNSISSCDWTYRVTNCQGQVIPSAAIRVSTHGFTFHCISLIMVATAALLIKS